MEIENKFTDWVAEAGLNDLRVLSVDQWCRLNGFSEATGYRIIKSGKGPRVVKLSTRRIGIRVCDHKAWQASAIRENA
jgi:predicted DNA-binding transcriptional regulator AlpA